MERNDAELERQPGNQEDDAESQHRLVDAATVEALADGGVSAGLPRADALRLADVALYLAKEQGRNRVVSKRQDA